MPIATTRRLLTAALDGTLKDASTYTDRFFGFQVPSDVAGIEPHVFHPRKTWSDAQAYDAQAARLVEMFNANFAKFEHYVDADVLGAAPQAKMAAE